MQNHVTGSSTQENMLQNAILGGKTDGTALEVLIDAGYGVIDLRRAGYSAAMLGKGRMRPATFFKDGRFALCSADARPRSSTSSRL